MTAPESEIVTGLNAFFESHGPGLAYRLRQSRFTKQPVDVLVDSARWGYVGIESKSLKLDLGQTHLYFSQHFSQGADVSRISEFLDRTGRLGLLAVTLRRGVGRETSVHILLWARVARHFGVVPGFRVEAIESWPQVPRKGGELVFTEEFLKGVLG